MSNILNNTENIHVKLQFNDEFRRFFIPSNNPIKYTDLQTKIKDLLNITDAEILIKYKDEEDEWITISSDVELETGLLVTGNGIFRLFCEIKGNNSQQPLQNSTCNTLTKDEPEERGNWRKYREKNRGGYKGKGNNKWKKNYQGKRYGNQNNSEMTPMDDSETMINSGNNSELTPMPNSEMINSDLTPVNTADDDKNWKERKQQFKREKRERKHGSKKDRRRKRDDKEEKDSSSSSESNSDVALLTLEEIKKEIDKLKEEEKILKEKARGAKESVQAVKNLIKEKRKDEKVQPDEILNLREDLNGKIKIKKSIQEELNNTRSRIRKLRDAAETKQV
jgi:hypothetical protein